MAKKYPRFVRPYPAHRPTTLVRRQKRGATKWELIRQKRPRVHARTAWGVRTRFDVDAAKENRAQQDIKGSLEERIFYKALISWGFADGIDFTFQTSVLGGRAELGGLVADFLFPLPMVIVNPTSVWHTMTLENIRRDDDQTAILASMGYLVLYLDPNIIHDQDALDFWVSRNIATLWGTSSTGHGHGIGSDVSYTSSAQQDIINRIEALVDAIYLKLTA